MVEDVGGIQPDGEALGLAEPEPLLDGHVGGPTTHVLKPILTERTALSRKWSLQHNLATRVLNGIESTSGGHVCNNIVGIVALRVLYSRIGGSAVAVRKDVAVKGTFFPEVVQVLDIEIADNVRHTKTVQHALRRDVGRTSGSHVYNPARLPVLREPRPDTRCVAEEKLVGSDRECERAIGHQ